MNPLIRKAVIDDAEGIRCLLAQLGYAIDSSTVIQQLNVLLSHPDEDVFVAELAGELVGFISIHYIPQIAMVGEFARISYFCIHENHRSKGIGRILEQEAEHQATRRNCDRVEVHCHTRRSEAHRFYYRQGYHESPKYLMKKIGSELKSAIETS